MSDKEIRELAEELYYNSSDDGPSLEQLIEGIKRAVESEREACALIAEAPIKGQPHTEYMQGRIETANTIAAAIRARSGPKEKKERRLR